jgi:hypothetical protein
MHARFLAAPALGLFLVASCTGEPLAQDKLEYAGQWASGGMSLIITTDGGVSYQNVGGSGTTTVNGPIQGWTGDSFNVGALGIETTFEVTAAPHETDDGKWVMTVDGVELTRIAQ